MWWSQAQSTGETRSAVNFSFRDCAWRLARRHDRSALREHEARRRCRALLVQDEEEGSKFRPNFHRVSGGFDRQPRADYAPKSLQYQGFDAHSHLREHTTPARSFRRVSGNSLFNFIFWFAALIGSPPRQLRRAAMGKRTLPGVLEFPVLVRRATALSRRNKVIIDGERTRSGLARGDPAAAGLTSDPEARHARGTTHQVGFPSPRRHRLDRRHPAKKVSAFVVAAETCYSSGWTTLSR